MFPLEVWRKGWGGCVRNIGHEHDFCQAQKAENTGPCTNYAVKNATARGHLNRVWELQFSRREVFRNSWRTGFLCKAICYRIRRLAFYCHIGLEDNSTIARAPPPPNISHSAPFDFLIMERSPYKWGLQKQCPYRVCGADAELPYWLFSLPLRTKLLHIMF